MAQRDLQQFPKPFPESTLTHLYRTAEVVVVKRLRNFLVPGLGQDETEHQEFQREFYEFLGTAGLLRPCKALDAKWQDPDAQALAVGTSASINAPLYRHYYVSATAAAGSPDSVTAPPKGNADVVSVRATVDTEGRGSCSLEIACPQDKYLFSRNPFRQGQAVFEPNDMVYVSLPGLDGRLYRVFTGLVSQVRVSKGLGESIETRVVLECEDMLKLLTQSRTAVKPSLTPEMSDGKVFSGLDNDFSGRLPHDIMAEILGLAYCDFYTAEGFYSALEQARASSTQAEAATAERRLLKSMVTAPPPSPSGPAYDPAKPFLIVGKATGAQPVQPTLTFDPENTLTSTLVPSKVYGFRRVRRQLAEPSTAVDKSVRRYAPVQVADMDDLAFVISGTSQPSFQLAFSGASSLYFADFKSGLALCRQVADDLNYEFFANQNGVVLFRPLNVSLPYDFEGSRPIPTDKIKDADGRVGSEFWLQDSLIVGQPTYVDSDVDIYTFAYASSDFQINSGGVQFFKGVAFDALKYLKFGARTAPLVTRLQLLTDELCELYASAYLSRLNASYSSAALQYAGDARLVAGNPCFVPSRNTVYYVSSVTHTFVAGQSYVTDLSLKYGRRPVAAAQRLLQRVPAMTDRSLATVVNNRTISVVLSRLVAAGATALANFIQSNREDLTFGDYVWEPLMPLNYEDLYADMAEQKAFNVTKETVEAYEFQSPGYVEQLKATKRRKPALVDQKLVDDVVASMVSARGVPVQ